MWCSPSSKRRNRRLKVTTAAMARMTSAQNWAQARPYRGKSRLRMYRAGISNTTLRRMAKIREFRPRPQAWKTPTAKKSVAKKGRARHMARRKELP